ncbi:MAG: pilin [Candidatus Nomurabacteria bacterium]|jgi:uncharacterized metal-binding protein|nr:pilin [Candidatus Nomurabacteria bacterium]
MKILNILAATVDDIKNKLPQGDPNTILKNGLNTFFIFVAIIAVIMIVYGGVQYIISTGDRTKIDTAKKTLLYAIVGLIVSASAFAITNFVYEGLK